MSQSAQILDAHPPSTKTGLPGEKKAPEAEGGAAKPAPLNSTQTQQIFFQTLKKRGPGRIRDYTGQIPPPGAAHSQVLLTPWNQEGTSLYSVTSLDITTYRREDNDMIHGTSLLEAAGVTPVMRDSLLRCQRNRSVVNDGPPQFQGVWITLEGALALANIYGITERMYPLFTEYIRDQVLLDPKQDTEAVNIPDKDVANQQTTTIEPFTSAFHFGPLPDRRKQERRPNNQDQETKAHKRFDCQQSCTKIGTDSISVSNDEYKSQSAPSDQSYVDQLAQLGRLKKGSQQKAANAKAYLQSQTDSTEASIIDCEVSGQQLEMEEEQRATRRSMREQLEQLDDTDRRRKLPHS